MLLCCAFAAHTAKTLSSEEYFEKAINAEDNGFYEVAIEYYQKIYRHRTIWRSIQQYGILYYDQKKLPQAIRCYQKAIDIDPNHAMAYYNMGYAYGQQGNTTKEREYIKKAVRLGNEEAQAYCKLKGWKY